MRSLVTGQHDQPAPFQRRQLNAEAQWRLVGHWRRHCLICCRSLGRDLRRRRPPRGGAAGLGSAGRRRGSRNGSFDCRRRHAQQGARTRGRRRPCRAWRRAAGHAASLSGGAMAGLRRLVGSRRTRRLIDQRVQARLGRGRFRRLRLGPVTRLGGQGIGQLIATDPGGQSHRVQILQALRFRGHGQCLPPPRQLGESGISPPRAAHSCAVYRCSASACTGPSSSSLSKAYSCW